jgi:hypothetical protein
VAADPEYASVAWLGVNLNQMYGIDTTSTVVPTGSALTVSFRNLGTSELRVQIGGPNSATDEYDRWCYAIAGSSAIVTIPYSSFHTHCWEPALGYYYGGEPLESVALIVPGSTTAVPFSACLDGVL